MKKVYCFTLFLGLLLLSCDKPKDFYDELGKGSYLTLVRQDNALLNALDPTSVVGQVVSSYGDPVESVNLYVSAAATLDKTKWKLLKNVPFSGETTLATTNTEIATALGLTPGALAPGSVFHLYNEAVLPGGSKFSSANTSDVDLENQAPFNVAFHWTATVVCPFDAATIAGTYEVKRDDWADWGVGDLVEVTVGATASQVDLSQVWPNPDFGTVVTPLTLNVDPATGVVTVPAGVVFGNYGGTNIRTGAGSTGFIFSCTGLISVRINIDGYGLNQLNLQKR